MWLRGPFRALSWLACALVASTAMAQSDTDAVDPQLVPDTPAPVAPTPDAANIEPSAPPELGPAGAPTPTPAVTAVRAASARGLVHPIAEQEDPGRIAPAWRAMLTFGQSYTAAGVAPSAYPTFDPTYAWSFLVVLGYELDERNAISLAQVAAIELTDSSTTNSRQEFLLLDTLAEYTHKLKYELDSGQSLALRLGAGLVLPTSKSSQASTLLLGTRARVAGGYTTKRVLEGLDAQLTVSYLRRFASSNTIAAESPFPCNRLVDASQSCAFLGGSTSVRDVLMLGVDGQLKLTDALTLGAQVSFFFGRAIGLGDAFDAMIDSGVVRIEDNSTTHWRNTRWLIFSIGYAFNDWFSAQANVTNIFAERGPDGSLRAPFNPLDTLLGLDLTVSFDQLYMNTRGHGGQ